ncbi:MAG: hypothetical protein ACKO15_14625, partial [Burkholderiales bacterium]
MEKALKVYHAASRSLVESRYNKGHKCRYLDDGGLISANASELVDYQPAQAVGEHSCQPAASM